MSGVKGCLNCHYGIKRGKLCVDCVRMVVFGAVSIIFAEVVRWALTAQ